MIPAAILIVSCRKESTAPSYTNFVSKELAISYNTTYINNLIDLVSGTIPEASQFKSHVISGVDIYKVVYKTNVNNQEINASGLVCVPETSGTYPVISFQNGTNTVYADAPSAMPASTSYQTVELVASMGYIVVIPDYPGFGESTQVPHPYLVAEPTVNALVDMLSAVKEMSARELTGITVRNAFYTIGYSQGGWATLELHKALELNYADKFHLVGSCCGAGPYNIYLLLQNIVTLSTYPVPAYIGYILNAYKAYNQFTNPVSDIMNEPYASRLAGLFNGMLTTSQISAQLTSSIPGLLTSSFLSGFNNSPQFSSVRDALNRNSIAPWQSYVPLLMIHGGSDTEVSPLATENMYTGMIQAGTSPSICKEVILPGLDHAEGVVPAMIRGFLFIDSLNNLNH